MQYGYVGYCRKEQWFWFSRVIPLLLYFSFFLSKNIYAGTPPPEKFPVVSEPNQHNNKDRHAVFQLLYLPVISAATSYLYKAKELLGSCGECCCILGRSRPHHRLKPNLKSDHAKYLVVLLKKITAREKGLNETDKEKLIGFWQVLQQEESDLIQLLRSRGKHSEYEVPEEGLALFIFNQLPAETVSLLKNLLLMPESSISAEDMDGYLEDIPDAGWVEKDGTLVNFTKYAYLDPGWAMSLAYYLGVITGIIPKADMAPPVIVDRTDKEIFKVVICGDWGTGAWSDGAYDCPALEIMTAMQKHEADAAIHLGDEYYAGTEKTVTGQPGEEYTHFVKYWQPNAQECFALGSNHGMYDGECGYRNVLLKSPLFKSQQGSNCFAIELPQWIIVGLDTARPDESYLFKKGGIDEVQSKFLQQIMEKGKKIVLLTHHNAISIDGTTQTEIWPEIVTAMRGRQPDYWLWGHQHLGIVYGSTSAAGKTKARCLGNGGIPVGKASELFQKDGVTLHPQILYYAHTPMPDPDDMQKNRVLNGFAVFTFTEGDVVEEFYNQKGILEWSSASGDSTAPEFQTLWRDHKPNAVTVH